MVSQRKLAAAGREGPYNYGEGDAKVMPKAEVAL